MSRSGLFDGIDGLKLRHRALVRRRVELSIQGIEPQSKKAMSAEDKLRIQTILRSQMIAQRRRPFRRGVAVQIHFETAGKNPAHIQTLAKSFLDLMSKPLPELGLPVKSRILFQDDRDIQLLSVSCQHGQKAPCIRIMAMPHRCLLEELAMAAYLEAERDDDSDRPDLVSQYEDRLDRLIDVRHDSHIAAVAGADVKQRLVQLYHGEAQAAVFEMNEISLLSLCYANNRYPLVLHHTRVAMAAEDSETHTDVLRLSPFRVPLPELPAQGGQSTPFREAIEKGLGDFTGVAGKLMKSTRIPIALQVLLKPPKGMDADRWHDLDNVVRGYLIKGIVAAMAPPLSNHLSPNSGGPATIDGTPKGVRTGLVSYEVWRLPRPPDDDATGFVLLNFLHGHCVFGDTFRRIEKIIDAAG